MKAKNQRLTLLVLAIVPAIAIVVILVNKWDLIEEKDANTARQGQDALTSGQRAITTFNRNWQNRMGLGGEGYLASPAVVAASALLGYMAPPSELGISWDPERFGV